LRLSSFWNYSPQGSPNKISKDFWQIAHQRRLPLTEAGVVLFRIHPATTERIQPLVCAFVEAARGWGGHISVLTADGIQMVPSRRG